MACSINLLCVKVNSIICMVKSGVGIMGSFCSYVYNTESLFCKTFTLCVVTSAS